MRKKAFNKPSRSKKASDIYWPPNPDDLNRALAPVQLPHVDETLEAEVKAENAKRAAELTELEKGMASIDLEEMGAYTKEMLRSLSQGKKFTHNEKLEKAFAVVNGLMGAVDIEGALQAEEQLHNKSREKLDDWTKQGAPTGQDIKPLKPIRLARKP